MSQNSQENIFAEISFFDKVKLCRSATSLKTTIWHKCFLVNFTKSVRKLFLQNTTRRLLLIIALSVVVKGELANETVNYDAKTKAYVPFWARSVNYRAVQVKEQVSEVVVLKNFVNSARNSLFNKVTSLAGSWKETSSTQVFSAKKEFLQNF